MEGPNLFVSDNSLSITQAQGLEDKYFLEYIFGNRINLIVPHSVLEYF